MPNQSTPPSRASIENTRMTRTASGVKLAYLASAQQGGSNSTVNSQDTTSATSLPAQQQQPTINTPNGHQHNRPLARERPFAREDNSNNSSRPPSIRSATSFGRPMSRFMPGHHARHHSTYSNFSTMSETALPWTTKDIGFNAISGVLNDPARRAQDISRPSKADIPPVAHASIPRIKPTDFDAYLQHVGPAFERYQFNHKDSNHDEPVVNVELPSVEEEYSPKQKRRNPYSLPPQHVLSNESLLDEDATKTPPRDLPMLENVPSVFFQPDFLLENPQIFDVVCEGADIVGHSGPNSPISTNSILQEKLSYYLDTVEVHLLREIENRSSSFFEALSNLQALHQQTLDCVSQIHSIRKEMKKIQETECKAGLEVIRIQVRKRNLEKLHRVTEIVKDIRSAQPMIQILLGQGDYFAALDLIEETRDTLEGRKGLQLNKGEEEDSEPIDLSNVKALANFSSQLNEMQKAVGVMMEHDFLSILLSDLSYKMENIDSAKAKEELLKLAESSEENKNEWENVDLEQEKDLLERMTPSTVGLLRTDMLVTTLQAYRERLMVEIKDIVRKRYPASTSPNASAEDQSGNLARQLKSMPFAAFFQMLLDIFSTLIGAIRRASVYHQLLLHIMETQKLDSDFTITFGKESADIVFSAADLAHVRCGKLMGFRSELNALLNPTDFYRLSSVIRTFILQCEVFCGRTCFGLRGTVLSQQKAFVDHFHMERVKQEAQLIENEQWAASEVPSDFQLIVDRICDGRISSFIDGTLLNQQQQHDGEKSTKHLNIDGHSYYVVGCSLLILKMFEDYLKCVLNLESMTSEVMQKLVELLKLFNSKVCQVILGAGAMRSAGLKNITAKHLALASQSLAVMIALIPKLKDCIGRQLPAKQATSLNEFDRIRKDYQNHQSEIHAKLVAIMNERFTAHVKAMQSIKWDEEELQTGKNANMYMETLVTETVRLHKVLAKYLPVHDLKYIMTQIFQSFTSQLSEELSRIPIKTEKGKNRLARDASFFTRRLKSLHNVDPPSNAVMEAVDNIVIPETANASNEVSPTSSSPQAKSS